MAASLVAVLFLNSLAFGLTFETIFDSVINTLFIASCVSFFILAAAPRIERLPIATRVLIIALGIIPSTAAGVTVSFIFLRFIEFEAGRYFWPPSGRTLIFSLIISYIFGLGGYLYLSSRDKLTQAKALIKSKEEAEEKAHALATEARLASLESRIHPHFLFNTLNSIAALIRKDPKKAEIMVERLSRILRYSLDSETDHLVSLRDEIKLSEDYLEIQKARFADKLEYKFEIEETVNGARLPSFAIHTLVENTVKHVTSESTEKTFLTVKAFRNNSRLFVRVQDNGSGFSFADVKKGHGLDNLKQRMFALYGEKAEMKIEDESQNGSVTLMIPNE